MFIILLESVRRRDYCTQFFQSILQEFYVYISFHFCPKFKRFQKFITFTTVKKLNLPEYFSLISPKFLFSLLYRQLEFIREKSNQHSKRKGMEDGASVYSCQRTA